MNYAVEPIRNGRSVRPNNSRISIRSGFDRIKDYVFNYCYQLMMNSMKNHFGKEYDINHRAMPNSEMVALEVTKKFISKYDKNYEKRIQNNRKDNAGYILNSCFFIKLEERTFAYISSGDMLGLLNPNYKGYDDSPIDLYIYVFGKKAFKYAKEIDNIIASSYNNDDLGIYMVTSRDSGYRTAEGKVPESIDITYNKLTSRQLKTLFYSHGEKEEICQHIQQFIDNESFYIEKQLLYKTGILLYGIPGTGKTSLVKALATEFNRSIIQISVSQLASIDLNRLTTSINTDADKRYIVLFEDIDSLFLNNNDGMASKEEEAIINKLLQFLDSNTSPNNVIFIATTNHKDRLSDSLLREGRFDLKVEIKPLKEKEAYIFANSFGVDYSDATEIISKLLQESPLINQSKLQTRLLAKIRHISVDKAEQFWAQEEETSKVKSSESEKIENHVSNFDMDDDDDYEDDDE